MGTACKTATGSRFRVAGTSALASSVGSKAASSRCITTGGTWACSTSSLKAATSEKPTVPSSWEVEEVGWEARAMRKHDGGLAEVAREQGRQARARTQSEAGQARKRAMTEIRQVEQSRQWDRQREDIHPVEVLERLAGVESKKPARPKLPPAVPDADPDRPVCALPVRLLREEPLP